MRIGILGAARISPPALLWPARDINGVDVTVIASRDLSRARAQADEFGVPHVVGSYDDLLSHPEVDAVYNPLPINLHHRWALAAITAGHHVLQEKPFAANAREATEIVENARAADRVVMEAFHWRYHPLATRITELSDPGRLGTLEHVEAGFDVEIDPADDVRHSYDLAGGALMDLGCYAVQWVRHVARAEPSVTAATMIIGRPDVDVDTRVDLEFPSGAIGQVCTSMVAGVSRRSWIRAEGTEATLTVEGALDPDKGNRVTLTPHGASTPSVDVEVPGMATYHYQLAAFLDAATNGTAIPTGGDDAVATMAVIDAAYIAAGLPLRGGVGR